MFESINKLKDKVNQFNSSNPQEIEQFRINLLGKKGEITVLFQAFRDVPAEQKKEFGKQLNLLKSAAQEKINSLKTTQKESEKKIEQYDNEEDNEEIPISK